MTAITISTSEFRKHNKKDFDTLAKFAGVWNNDVYTAEELIADITKSRHSTRVVEEL